MEMSTEEAICSLHYLPHALPHHLLAFLLPFVFILTAVVTLEGVNKCSSFDCLGRLLGPKLLGQTDDSGQRMVKDFVKILNQVNSDKVPDGLKLPESFSQLVSEMKNNKHTSKDFALILKAMAHYLLFPNLDKLVFLDDDVVIQRDLSPLWEIDLNGKVNGAVKTYKGEDKYVMSKRFRIYFNFSHPFIAKNLNPNECAWAYGMNIFDLRAWRKTIIRDTYHTWLKENLELNLTLWKLGTLPTALIAFRGHVHPIDPSWNMLGLGY